MNRSETPMLPLGIEPVRDEPPAWIQRLTEETDRLWQETRTSGAQTRDHLRADATLILSDSFQWLRSVPDNCIHAVVTDPPYGVVEYDETNQQKLREGRGGVWRVPPTLDGVKRKPLPRFTVLSEREILALREFFARLACELLRVLVPGGHVIIASNPLLSSYVFVSFQQSGFEKRGELIRLVQTLRGGDRPKGAEEEFANVSVMPRSTWEPWGIFRKPFPSTVAENLRIWGTGALRRTSEDEPFKDVIPCAPARGKEKELAPHPSLKPQRFLRKVVRAALPLGMGTVLDPFAGSGSTLAAAHAVGYRCLGIERDRQYYELARRAFSDLSQLST